MGNRLPNVHENSDVHAIVNSSNTVNRKSISTAALEKAPAAKLELLGGVTRLRGWQLNGKTPPLDP